MFTEFSPKLKLFRWKVIQGAIPLGENLAKRGLLGDTNCLHFTEEETTIHLFFPLPFCCAGMKPNTTQRTSELVFNSKRQRRTKIKQDLDQSPTVGYWNRKHSSMGRYGQQEFSNSLKTEWSRRKTQLQWPYQMLENGKRLNENK
ncbi:unnamed protein product [Arabis nemorensis]|uniref:Reverse transcriptase zinc-binding domain-containing protein n=1 Tax=Arabis nemorensis TaxID=586526 RepID=A0A565CM81_9BRAS|nr:unnamed protein product [Arabis nemorensis]